MGNLPLLIPTVAVSFYQSKTNGSEIFLFTQKGKNKTTVIFMTHRHLLMSVSKHNMFIPEFSC